MNKYKKKVIKFWRFCYKKFNNIFNQENDDIAYSGKDVDPSIFREYDIRGIYNQTLKSQDALFIGNAIAYFLVTEKKELKNVVVGYDGRISSPSLVKSLISGLASSGCYVTNIGLCPTPMLYYAMSDGNYDFGIMVTGSHNPKDYNGFKFIMKDKEIFGKDILHIKQLVAENKNIEGLGREIIVQDVKERYISDLLKDIDILGNLDIAWDLGNGAASIVVKKLIKQVPGNHILLFDEINGTFPNRNPDPTQADNLSYLKQYILDNKCDFGIAFDGDADRLCIMTNKGRLLYGDQLLAIFAESILENRPGSLIISDVKASRELAKRIESLGGKFVVSKVGHSIIAQQLKELKAILAGEMSGHFFFADKWLGFDDGIYAALRFIEIFSKNKNNGINIFDYIIDGYNTPEIRIDCDDDKKFEIIDKLKQILSQNNIKYNSIDGIRVETDTSWWLLRASNTQAQLTLRVEATTEIELRHTLDNVAELLRNVSLRIPDINSSLN